MNEFKVGLMAIATLVAVVYMSFSVTSNQSGFGDYVTYRTIVQDASGIFPKTPIKVAGINAGRIKNIELQGNNALITFEVLEEIGITQDSRLRVKTVGFLGDKYLEISVGRSSEMLESMGFLIADESGGMEDLLDDAGKVLKDVKTMTQSFRQVFSPEGEDPPLKNIMESMESLTSSLDKTVSGNRERLDEIIKNIEMVTQSLAEETDKQMADSSVSKLRDILSKTQGLTGDLELLVHDIKQGKGTMGKLLVEEEIADEVRETLSGVKKIVTRVDSLRTELGVYTGGNTRYGAETEAYMKLFPSPERYYLLGITTSEIGPETEKIFTTIQDGKEESRIEKEAKKDALRFNLQLGRRVHNWGFRGGLIESTGGFGVDYYLPSWGMKFTSDLYDYRDDIGINFRLSSELQIWNVIYGKVAIEDVLYNETRSATISAGLKFNDEDLKGLIGFFL